MSEFHFGVGRGRVKEDIAKKIDRIARTHGATFTTVTLPGEGPRYWFSGPNMGPPFDNAMARGVRASLIAAGIADENCYIKPDFFQKK